MSRFDGSRGPPRIEGMTSLKVDNLTYRTTIDELDRYFTKFGEVGDIYIPRDRHRRESRGFAFVRYFERRDAEDAMDSMDGAVIDGREIRVQLAKYGRPTEQYVPPRDRGRSRYGGGGRYGGRDRSPGRRRRRSRSRSRSRGRRSRSRSRSASPRRYSRRYSRSPRKYSRSRSPNKSRSPSRSPRRSRSRSRSPVRRSRSPSKSRSRSRSVGSPKRSRSPSPARSGSPDGKEKAECNHFGDDADEE